MPSLFAALLYLYPAPYRNQFGDEMISVLSQVSHEARTRGVFAQTLCYSREIAGLLRGALREHMQGSLPGRTFPMLSRRRLLMRSEFRFPKSTVTLMLLILAALFLVIEKAKELQLRIAASGSAVGPTEPAHVAIIPAFFLAFLLVAACAVLGWAIVFAFRRSGMHRLARLNPSSPKTTLSF
jgi:hypothetical protein